MAADHPGLNPVPAPGPGGGALLALGLLLPMLAWTAVTAMEVLDTADTVTDFSARTLHTLLLTQSLAVMLLLPWFAGGSGWRDTLLGPLLIMLVPLPLLALLALSGAMAATDLLRPLALLCLALPALSAGMHLLATPLRGREHRIPALTAVALLGAAIAWAGRDTWTGWIGL